MAMPINKIVLFNPMPSKNNEFNGLPLALLSISRYLFLENFNIVIISAFSDSNYQEKALEEMKDAICFGVTCMTGYQITDALNVCKLVKVNYPEKKIIWGGWHPSILPRQTLKNRLVDVVCIGQGEKTFYELVKAIEKNENLRNIKGIAYKNGHNIVFNAPRPIEDINAFPNIPHDLVDIDKYLMATDLGNRTVNYISSYGCPFNCGFCAETIVNKRRWSGLCAKKVVDDIEYLFKKHKIDSVIFNDSNFFLSEKRIFEICSELTNRNIEISFGLANGTASVMNKYDHNTFDIMKRSGCKSILIGAESGSEEILKYAKKSGSIEDIIIFTNICKKYDFKIIPSFIIGFPREENNLDISIEDEFNMTIDLIKRMSNITKNIDVLWFNYVPYPGTYLYNKAIALGLEEPKSLTEWADYELTNEGNIQWIPIKYSKRIDFLMKLIFPLVLNTDNITNLIRSKSKIYYWIINILRIIAKVRLTFNIYDFPVELYFSKIVYNIIKPHSDSSEAVPSQGH